MKPITKFLLVVGLLGSFCGVSYAACDSVKSGFHAEFECGETYSITGVVYGDANNDGVMDNGESGLSGWTVTLVSTSNNAILQTTTTNANGVYEFNVGDVAPNLDSLISTSLPNWNIDILNNSDVNLSTITPDQNGTYAASFGYVQSSNGNVPEPASVALVALGLVSLFTVLRRRRQQK